MIVFILTLIGMVVICIGCSALSYLYGYRKGSADYGNFLADKGFLRKEEEDG